MPNRFNEDWQGLVRSLATYTRIPLQIDWNCPQKHTSSVCFLPFVGAVVALLSAWPLLCSSWSAGFQALLMIGSAVLLTGGFHEDGLMDACDGLIGGWTPEQRLTIMKDSRVGSYGALAGVFSVAAKWWLLSQWLSQSLWGETTGALLAGWVTMHLVARWLPLVLMQGLPYVNAGQSKAQSMLAPITWRAVGWLGVSVCVVYLLVGLAMLLTLLGVTILLGAMIGWYLKRRLKGYNGDTLGASEQIAELMVLFALLGWVA